MSRVAFVALAGLFFLSLVTATQIANAKKTQWCIVDKKSGDYSSDCFKTREECQKRAAKKGSGFGCGVNYE